MGAKVYVTDGGGPTATDVDFSSQVPLFDKQGTPQVDLGMACDNGSASQGTFIVFDPIGEIPRADGTKHLSAHNRVLLTVDASGTEYWLSRGRVGQKNIGRHPISKAGAARQHEVQVDDANVDVRGLALREAVSRPAETGWQRLAFFHAYTLAGSASTAPKFRDTTTITFDAAHLAPNTNTVTMPAKTYPAGSDLVEIINECRDTEAKAYAVVIHHTGGSHLCALYIDPGDHTTYASTCRISDSWDEHDPDGDLGAPTFFPVYDMGPAATEDGQELAHAIVSTWGVNQVADVEQLSTIEGYDYWAMPYYDAQSQNATQAAQVAAAQLTENKLEHVTHQLSILVRESKAHLIAAGMSIQVKAAATMGGQYLNTWQTRRIALCKWQPAFPNRPGEELWWWAHLNLDRAFGNVYSRGNRAIATTPKPSPTKNTPTTELSVLWDYEEGNNKDTTGTYAFNDEVVDSPGALTSHWGHCDPPENAESSKMPCAEGQLVHVMADVAAQTIADLQTRALTVRWYQTIGDVNGDVASPTAVSNPCSAGAGVVGKIDQSWTVPAGITYFTIGITHGVYIDNIQITVTEPAAEDDPEARDEDLQGDSPYYLRSDDLLPSSQVIYGGQPLDTTLDELVGADNAEVYSFAAAPTTGDDSDDGYEAGDLWIDTSASPKDVYVLTDATVGSAVWKKLASTQRATITFIIDGGGSAITTGVKGDVQIDFDCTIESATVLADQSGSIVIDVWKDSYANFPPTLADTITASAKPTLASAQKSQDATLTGWSKSIAAGDVLRFNVDSATTVQRVTLALKVKRI